MATTNYNLPTLTGNMTPNVVRDHNALATAVDAAIKGVENIVPSPSAVAGIVQQINEVESGLTAHKDENAHIKISENAPADITVGNLWFDLGETNDVGGGGEGTFVFGNGILSDGEPGDINAIWLDYDE